MLSKDDRRRGVVGRRSQHRGGALLASLCLLVATLGGVSRAGEVDALLQPGSYEVRFRLELPNVTQWNADRTTRICVPRAERADAAPLPVLSGNNPLARCPARNIRRQGATLSFEIVCEGRNAARARALYTLGPREFRGRIAMVMGGKNMTMTEVQSARRVGGCDPAGSPEDRSARPPQPGPLKNE